MHAPRLSGAATLLIIGIHREELAFGRALAATLEPGGHDLLVIPEGLSGRRPRADQHFHYDTLHRALYLQLLPHIQERHRLVIDLHTGLDTRAPCADLYSRAANWLAQKLQGKVEPAPHCIPLGLAEAETRTHAHTSIPPEIWNAPRFLYVGMEMYLPTPGPGREVDQDHGRALVTALTDLAVLLPGHSGK